MSVLCMEVVEIKEVGWGWFIFSSAVVWDVFAAVVCAFYPDRLYQFISYVILFSAHQSLPLFMLTFLYIYTSTQCLIGCYFSISSSCLPLASISSDHKSHLCCYLTSTQKSAVSLLKVSYSRTINITVPFISVSCVGY